jgi:hypothetical protein
MDEEEDKKEKPAPKKPDMPVHPLHIAAGVLFLIVALAFLHHRMPKTKYVAVNADKPRPTAARADAPAAPKAAAPAPAAKPGAPGTPATSVAAAPAASAAPGAPGSPARPAPKPGEVEKPRDLSVACAAEAPLLCYRVAEEKLRRCLLPYEDAVRKICRDALIPPTAPADDEEAAY